MAIDAASGAMTSEEIVALNRAHTFFSWSAQGAIDPIAIDPAAAAPDYCHHVHNRLSVNEAPRAYTRSRHQAWLHRRRIAL